jgi:predicted nucleic acid-binding protein
LPHPDREVLLADYLPYAEVVTLPNPLPTLSVACRDRDDIVFLQLALTAQVTLVSGDGDLTALRGIAPVPVISVAELHDRV